MVSYFTVRTCEVKQLFYILKKKFTTGIMHSFALKRSKYPLHMTHAQCIMRNQFFALTFVLFPVLSFLRCFENLALIAIILHYIYLTKKRYIKGSIYIGAWRWQVLGDFHAGAGHHPRDRGHVQQRSSTWLTLPNQNKGTMDGWMDK